ncbi:Heat shock factor protein 3 [Asimina triloba]
MSPWSICYGCFAEAIACKALPIYCQHKCLYGNLVMDQGFRKVDPDRWEFANEGFLRGQKHLLKTISRRKPSHVHVQPQPPQGQSASVGACVEVGKFGLEEEVERLKRDKNVLMQELVRLRQQQQTTDHQLQTLVQRLQGMEQRQQQMMSFLAKAMQSPGFLAQLVQQNDSNRRIAAANKKRRLPKHEDGTEGEKAATPDGQIVKYQPLMNEAAKSMLMQILKASQSPRIETSNTSDSFLIDNVSSQSGALGDGSSSNRISGVTVAEVPPTSGISYMPVASGFSGIRPSAAISEIQSSCGATDMVTTPDIGVLPGMQDAIVSPQTDIGIPEFAEMQNMVTESSIVDIPSEGFVVPDAASSFIDPMAGGVDGAISIEADKFSVDADIDSLFDEVPRLPGINDSFWEQFLSTSPISGDTEEVEAGIQEASMKETGVQEEKEKRWDKTQNMEHLTEQMGLLSSEGKG